MHLELTEDEKAKIKKLTVMTGVVKKKRDKGTVIALVSASEQKYFCFKGMGRFLVHYADKKKPGLYDKPESVIFVNEIKEIVDNYEGKKSHFYLKMENEGIHMKCDEQKEKERWVESLRGLMEIFKGKKILDWDDDRRSHKEEMDVRVMNIIMDEQEDEYMNEINKKLNFDSILKLKKLKTALDQISPKIFKNHIQMGKVWQSGGQLSGKEGEGTTNQTGIGGAIGNLGGMALGGIGLNSMASSLKRGLSSWVEYFCIIVTSKAFTVFGEEVDDVILTETDLPHWMDLDTLYEFKIENDKDESEFIRKVNAKQMVVIEPVLDKDLKSNQHLVMETKERYSYCGVEYCKEINRWLAALRKARSTREEVGRSKAGNIIKNVDWVMNLYRRKVTQW